MSMMYLLFVEYVHALLLSFLQDLRTFRRKKVTFLRKIPPEEFAKFTYIMPYFFVVSHQPPYTTSKNNRVGLLCFPVATPNPFFEKNNKYPVGCLSSYVKHNTRIYITNGYSHYNICSAVK